MVDKKESIEALIIASEVTKGMKSIGSKSLLKIKQSTVVIEYQINELRKTYKNINITVATGFESDKMVKLLAKSNVNFLHNPEFESTNQAKSISDFINRSVPKHLLIINSGILFKELPKIKHDDHSSQIFVLDKPKPDFIIGCQNNTDLSYLFYDLPQKWGECVLLSQRDILILKKITENKNINQLYIFEVINILSDYGCKFIKNTIHRSNIMKISNTKDICRARSFI